MSGPAVGVSAVDAAGDETVGVVWAVDAVVTVGGTAVDVAEPAAVAVYAADVVPVVDVSAAELQTFPGDAAAAFAVVQQENQFDCL